MKIPRKQTLETSFQQKNRQPIYSRTGIKQSKKETNFIHGTYLIRSPKNKISKKVIENLQNSNTNIRTAGKDKQSENRKKNLENWANQNQRNPIHKK